MASQRWNRLLTTAAFTSVAAAAIAVVLISTPSGPWAGLYRSYTPAWALLIISAVGILWRVGRNELQWPLLLLWGILFSLAVGSLSVQWGYVWGVHDPWAHTGNIRFQVFDLARNTYPAFHIWNAAVGDLLGVSGVTVLRYSALLATAIGGLGLAAVLRVLPVSRTASQRAFVAGLPAIFLAFIPRPFTLGWPFVLVIAWAVFTPLDRRRALSLLLLVGVGLTALHPQIPFLASAFLFAAAIVQWARPYLPRSYQETDIPFAARQLAGLIAVYAVVVSVYMVGISGAGRRILNRFMEIATSSGDTGADVTTPVETPTETSTPDGTTESPATPSSGASANQIPTPEPIKRRAQKVSQLAKLMQQPSLITELLARLSYGLVLGFAVLVGALERLRQRRVATAATVVLVAAGLYALFYLFSDMVLNNRVIGVMRSLQVVPLVLAPGIAFALCRRGVRLQHLTSVVVVLILVTGLVTAYPSGLIGATANGATSQQVAGVDWVGTYAHNESVTGTGMTFWILQGRFGKERIFELAPRKGNPKVTVRNRVGYTWQVRSPSGLIVVDSFSQARARQEMSESGDRAPLRDLETMPLRNSRIYSNGGTAIYGNESVAGG